MPAADLPLLIDAAREAGKIATRFSGTTAQRWDKPDGAGPVTEADLAVNAMLEEKTIAEGDQVIITKGDLMGTGGGTNAMKIVKVGSMPNLAD